VPGCDARIDDAALLAYWAGDAAAPEADALEDHLFGCDACTARLTALSSLQAGVAALAREGRVWGLLTRSLLNRLQRDGVRIRVYVLEPGDTVACAAHPGDDLLVAALRADFSHAPTASLAVTGADSPVPDIAEIAVPPSAREVLVAVPGRGARELPSVRLALRLTTSDGRRVLGEYVLDHTRLAP
jgi:hypothetical protein